MEDARVFDGFVLRVNAYNIYGSVQFFRKGRLVTEAGTPTFDQLRVFLAVVEDGTLAGAGRRLGRATSAVSYAVDNLEAQLGIVLFDRQTTRRPVLTDAGRVVLAEARNLSAGIDRLAARVRGLRQGLEAQISLAVDVMLPTSTLVDTLQAFRTTFPTVPIRLRVEALGAVLKLVLEGEADLGVSGPLRPERDELVAVPFTSVTLVPVAAPDHPLASADRRLFGAVRDHVQLVLTDRSDITAGQDFGVFAAETWRVADLGSKHALLLAGVGWGFMPETMVRGDVTAGRLALLDLPELSPHALPLQSIRAARAARGPAARWLAAKLSGARCPDADATDAGVPDHTISDELVALDEVLVVR